MAPTNIAAYKRHKYSGPRASLKRVRAARRRLLLSSDTNSCANRATAWRKNVPSKKNEARNEESNNEPVVIQPRPDESKPVMQFEATYDNNDPVEAESAEFSEIYWPEEDPLIDTFEQTQENETLLTNNSLSGIRGHRIVDLKHVIQWAFLLERHRNMCESSQIEFVCERCVGFRRELVFKCSMCDKTWNHYTENNDKINTAFVWATITAGSDYTQASHITSLMDIPTMSASKFQHTEKKLGKVWFEHLTEEIKSAGEQERSIAIEKGHVSKDGVPFVTVYVDGGWSNRSHGDNFDSPSGMACIIGKETKKCLYLGVRNKYCYSCQYYQQRNIDMKEHNCCKNFTGPSTAMESHIIVEGFQKSEEMHQLRYLNFIGDGDSPVLANLKQKVSYGNQIQKIECKNLVIKNYTSALNKILANTKLPFYGRNILKPRLAKLTGVARKILMNDSSDHLAVDIRNGPLHVFGIHDNCKDYYCNVNQTSVDESEKEENLIKCLKKSSPDVFALIYAANERIALKAGHLSNENTDVAQNFMSVINKFICGKEVSLERSDSVYVADT